MKTKLFLLALALCSLTFYGCDDDDNNDNKLLSSSIKNFIFQKYPDARIVEVDREGSYIEVDIWHQGSAREVVFTMNEEWIWTKTDVRFDELPEAVKTAYYNSGYTNYRIDDIDHYDTPTGEYYIFEFDHEPHDIYLKIYPNGSIGEL